MAVPEGQREELISAKRLSAMAIICQLLVTYQPGGLAEKELILRSLELPPESANLVEAVQSLRRWARWRRRAADLQISEPDPFLLEGPQQDHQKTFGEQPRPFLQDKSCKIYIAGGFNSDFNFGDFLCPTPCR